MPTPPPDAASLARVFGDASAPDDALEALERHTRINEYLLSAIRTGDSHVFKRAIAAEADVNYAGGKPLQEAAAARNFLFMKELVVNGADIPHAFENLKAEQAAIQRKKKYNEWGDSTGYTFKNKVEKARWSDIATLVKTLEDYQKKFIAEIMPLESVRLQQETLREIRAIKKEIYEANHGVPVNKPRIKAPKIFD